MTKTKHPCTISGVHYESEYAAAKVLGISADVLRYRLRSPNFTEYTSEHRTKFDIKPQGRACAIDGIEYESETKAAKASEITVGALVFRLRSANYPEYVSQYHPKKEFPGNFIPCSVAGVEYRSIGRAARNLGISDASLRTRLASLDYPDHVCADIPKKPKPEKPIRYKVRGKLYRTLQEIGDEEGITRERVRQKMNSPRHSDYERL